MLSQLIWIYHRMLSVATLFIYTYNKNFENKITSYYNRSIETRAMIVGLRPALEGFVVTMHEGACETGSQIPTA